MVLRSERGGEFYSDDLKEFSQEHGIRRLLTASCSAQQNSVAERKNLTIVEMAKSMLKEKGMPETFWAVNTTVSILNRSPTKAVLNRTPFEAWFGEKPVISHMKVLGSFCYAHVRAEKKIKMG